MGSATGWVRRHPGVLVLLAAVIIGQLLKVVLQPYLTNSPLVGQVPLVPAVNLAAAIGLILLIVWLRVRLGHQLVKAARGRALSLPAPASLPGSYAVKDAANQVTSGCLGLLDLALLLLVQATLLAPVLVLADRFLVPRPRTTAVFVGLVVLIALLMLVKLWRVGGPVLVLLLWWALDRVVPTAGFLGARAEVATAPTTVSKPVAAIANSRLVAAPTLAASTQDISARAEGATVPAVKVAPGEATVLAEATVVSRPGTDDDATVVSRSKDEEATVLKPESA